MRPRFLLFVGLVVALILALLLFKQQEQKDISSKSVRKESQTNSAALSVSAALRGNNNLLLTNNPRSVSQPSAINDREKTNEIRRYIESQNKPIEFYGRVVDQDGNSLAGVSIKGEALRVKVIVPTAWGDEDEIIPISTETDSAGRFEIEGISGRAVELESMQKSGYEAEPLRRAWKASEGTYANPVVFKMWSVNIHAKLIIGEKPFDIIPDGRAYFINLTDDAISETVSGSDLKIWIQFTNHIVHGQLYDWSAGIEVIDGGLLESSSYSMFSAPADGYIHSFTSQQQIKGGQRGEIGERRFYLKLKNGREYGRMIINLISPFNDETPGLIRLSYAVNPSGSRILKP